MNSATPIGCTTSSNAVDSGFIPFSEVVAKVDSMEDCLRKAEEHGQMCSEQNPSGEKSCSYIMYSNGNVYDLLRDADQEYRKSKNAQSASQAKRYRLKSLKAFEKIWLGLTPAERKEQLSESSGVSFLYGYAPWIAKNKSDMRFFEENADAPRIPLVLNNKCWIGGKKVLNSGHIKLVDMNSSMRKNPMCKHPVYLVPSADGGNYQERLHAYYKQKEQESVDRLRKAKIEAKTSRAMAEFVNKNSGAGIFNLFQKARETKAKVEVDAVTEDTVKEIKRNLQVMKNKNKYLRMIQELKETTQKGLDHQKKEEARKKKILQKMDADLQNLNWSLNKSQDNEILRNQITTTLGFIVILLAVLCVAGLIYYLMGDRIVSSFVKRNVVGAIFSNASKTKVADKSTITTIKNLFKF